MKLGRLAIPVLVLAMSGASQDAVAGMISAASIPASGSAVTVGNTLTITVSVDPAFIEPSLSSALADNSEITAAVFQLTVAFDVANVFRFDSESSTLPGGTVYSPVSDPLEFNQFITVTQSIDANNPVLSLFDVVLRFTAVQASVDPVSFSASIGTVYRDEQGQVGSINEDYDSQLLTYTTTGGGANPVPEPGSLLIFGAALGLCGWHGWRRRLRRSTR